MITNSVLKEILVSNEKFIMADTGEIFKRAAGNFPDKLDKTFVIYGVRRSGKTYILYDLYKERADRALYIDFEDERLDGFETADFEKLKNAFFELKPGCLDKKPVFFLDEVQNVKGWEKFCRRAVERENISVYVSGSSSKMMPFEIATELRGRAWSVEVLPYSFKEYLRAKGAAPAGLMHGRRKSALKKHFWDYLRWGGFPEVAQLDSDIQKSKLVKEYLSAMYFRDLVEKYEVSNIHLFECLSDRLFSSFALKYSLTSFYRQYQDKFPFSKDLLFRYYKYFLRSMLILEVKKFSESTYKRLRNPSKIYLVDNALSRRVASADEGRLLENAVFLELKRTGHEVFYFDEGLECDFIVKNHDGAIAPIQICLELSPQNQQRELAGLVTACKWLNRKEGLLITLDEEKELTDDGVKISVLPAWKFLLQ
ncbi:MAG: ATP-binding protein [Elusimicrobia bacterium]|nr:ATP-binding protein [Elusimicrobiota bacterium]